MCQSLDRHARIQNTTLMNGVNYLGIEEQASKTNSAGPRLLRVQLEMTDGHALTLTFERYFATRNTL